jgi:hypothetical protein
MLLAFPLCAHFSCFRYFDSLVFSARELFGFAQAHFDLYNSGRCLWRRVLFGCQIAGAYM